MALPVQIKLPEDWQRGQRITALRLQQPVDAIRALVGIVRPPQQVRERSAAVPPVVALFRIESVAADHLVCRRWDDLAGAGAEDVLVAKSYLLRRTPFDGKTRDGITYTYTTDIEREATEGADSETQVVVPLYVAGDVIAAASPVSGHFLQPTVAGLPTTVPWLDLNLDGRAWAKKAT